MGPNSNCYTIGVDLGGTNLRIAAVSPSGQIRDKISLDTDISHGRERVVREIAVAVNALKERFKNRILLGIGVGLPGIIDMATGTVRQAPNLPGFADFPFRHELEQRLESPVLLENDANAAALGEKWLGTGREVSGLCILTLGTGIGGGLVLDGRVWHGRDGMGAEMGHTTVDPNGLLCGCGNLGCVEAYASATAIVKLARSAARAGRSAVLAEMAMVEGGLTAESVFEAAQSGDRAAMGIFEMAGRALGVAVANLINIFNLPLYVVGGGVARGWEAFAPVMLREVEARSVVYRAAGARIEPSALQGDAGLFGAAYLPLQAQPAAMAQP